MTCLRSREKPEVRSHLHPNLNPALPHPCPRAPGQPCPRLLHPGLRERVGEWVPVTLAPILPPAPLCFPRQVSITALRDPGSHILCLVPQPCHIDLLIQLFNWSVGSGFRGHVGEEEARHPSRHARDMANWPCSQHLITPALCQALNRAVGESDSPGPLDAHRGGDRQGAHRRSPIFNFTLASHPISCRFQFQDGSQPPTR